MPATLVLPRLVVRMLPRLAVTVCPALAPTWNCRLPAVTVPIVNCVGVDAVARFGQQDRVAVRVGDAQSAVGGGASAHEGGDGGGDRAVDQRRSRNTSPWH